MEYQFVGHRPDAKVESSWEKPIWYAHKFLKSFCAKSASVLGRNTISSKPARMSLKRFECYNISHYIGTYQRHPRSRERNGKRKLPLNKCLCSDDSTQSEWYSATKECTSQCRVFNDSNLIRTHGSQFGTGLSSNPLINRGWNHCPNFSIAGTGLNHNLESFLLKWLFMATSWSNFKL